MNNKPPPAKLRAYLSKILGRDVGEWVNCYTSSEENNRLAEAGRVIEKSYGIPMYVAFFGEVVSLSYDTHSGPGINYSGPIRAHTEERRKFEAQWRRERIDGAIKTLKALKSDEVAEVRRRFKGL